MWLFEPEERRKSDDRMKTNEKLHMWYLIGEGRAGHAVRLNNMGNRSGAAANTVSMHTIYVSRVVRGSLNYVMWLDAMTEQSGLRWSGGKEGTTINVDMYSVIIE